MCLNFFTNKSKKSQRAESVNKKAKFSSHLEPQQPKMDDGEEPGHSGGTHGHSGENLSIRSPSLNLLPKKSILKNPNAKKTSFDLGYMNYNANGSHAAPGGGPSRSSRLSDSEHLLQAEGSDHQQVNRRNSISGGEQITSSSINDTNAFNLPTSSSSIGSTTSKQKAVKKLKPNEDGKEFELLRDSSIVHEEDQDHDQDEELDGSTASDFDRKVKFDEMNIIETLHPADKTYGHMKIEEPNTPYNYHFDEVDTGEDQEGSAATRERRASTSMSASAGPDASTAVPPESSKSANNTCDLQEKELIRVQLEEAAKKLQKHQIAKGDSEEHVPMDVEEEESSRTKPDQQNVNEENDESEEEDEPADDETRANRKAFANRRKMHYNEFYAVKLARSLIDEDDDDENEDEKKEG